MADTTLHTRDERGDWGPTYLRELPAPMVWPPRLMGTLKWLFGWPGYLWPWNTLWLGMALGTWFFLTPALASMQTFELWWIALIFARNVGLAVLYYGGLHLYFYVANGQGTDFKYSTRGLATKSKTFLFGSQVRENMFVTLASGVTIWSAYEVVTWWVYANGLLPFMNWASDPVWFVALLALIPMIREVHFYLVHRLLHWKPVYKLAHHLHHRNVNIGPWSGLSMHPVEHVLYFSGVLVHWVIASHPIHVMYHLFHLSFSPAAGHSGYDRIGAEGGKGVTIGAYMHYLHHQYFECNYGGDGLPIIDTLMGTFHDGSKEAHERMNKRLEERRWARQAAE